MTTELLVLCAFPADEVFVELPIDSEREAFMNQLATASIGLLEVR